jgi:hypothetical protein
MIEEAAAIEVARMRAMEQGWDFSEPLDVIHHRGWLGSPGHYTIETNAGKLGTKARFVIDATTGIILSEGYIPR